ncbi:hypothetical protein G9A89_023356 [Geosiphon pyriformis]|nr:hypothetical protein G9A89_023356 [Geosiphon pyriformis]
MSEKRLVDYVFLAGLPQDFHLPTPTESSATNTDIKFAQNKKKKSDKSERNKTSTKLTPTITTITTTTNNDEESVRFADATLFESIRASIVRFDNERDDFLKSLGRGMRDSGTKNGNSSGGEGASKARTSIAPSSSIFRNGSIISTKFLKNLDEGFSETDSLSSSSTVKNNVPMQEDPQNSEHRISYLNVAPQVPSSKGNIYDPGEHPLKQKYSPRLLARYPQKDYSKEESFPAYIPMFCFPNDVTIRESEYPPPTTYHGFAMTQEDGSKRYGICLTTFEPISESLAKDIDLLHKDWCAKNMTASQIEYANHLATKMRYEKQKVETARIKLDSVVDLTSGQRDEIEREKLEAEEKVSLYVELLQPIKSGIVDITKLWLPKCIGVISELPWHDVLRDWLCAVAMPMVQGLKEPKQLELPLERYIVNLVHEIPVPPPGKLQVAISVNDLTLFCGRPPLNQIPLMNDFSLFPVFRSLSFKTILTLLEAALAEAKILLISSYPDMLFLAAHSITYLMYPLYWQGVFIPILPARLMACLQAPVPYIMGIQRQYKGMDLLPEDACIVDLDKDTIMIAQHPPQIPSRQRKKLMQSLEAYAPLHSHYSLPYGVPLYVQQAYPNGRFTPLCAKSRIYEPNDRITSVIGTPARAIPLAPSMTGLYDMDRDENLSSPHDPFPRSSSLVGVPAHLASRRHSTFSGSTNLYEDSIKSGKSSKAGSLSEKSVKNKNRFSSLAGARNSIMSLRSKALNRSSIMVLNRNGNGHAHKISGDVISLPQTSNSSQYDNESLFSSDGWSVMADPAERIPIGKDFSPKEGHLMVEIQAEGNSDGQPGMSTWMLEGLACGICQKSLGLNVVLKCEGCSMVAHEECFGDITYPCMPACFNEAKVQDAFLRVFASLLRHYRTYMVEGTKNSAGENSRGANGLFDEGFYFRREIFLKTADKEAKPFLSSLVDSQAFSHFIHERLTRSADDPEILHFDEVIAAKLNRSKLKLSKETTLFLNDPSYSISQTVRAMKPAEDDLDLFAIDCETSRLPSSFNPEFMYTPRPSNQTA